ncbi:MAG TPA: hypothetical protein VI454_12110 [Verrucomicrobiae bacterium]
MSFFIFVLLITVMPLNGLALWSFMRFRPNREARGVKYFDTAVYVVLPVVCAFFSFWVHSRLEGRIEPDWVPAFAALAWPAAFPVLLTAAGLIRNAIFARPSRS